MKSYPDWVEQAAFDSMHISPEVYRQAVRDRVITRHELNRSVMYLENDINYISFLGYAGSRKDYAEAFKVAHEIAKGRPLLAIVYKKHLDSIQEAVKLRVTDFEPIPGKVLVRVLDLA